MKSLFDTTVDVLLSEIRIEIREGIRKGAECVVIGEFYTKNDKVVERIIGELENSGYKCKKDGLSALIISLNM